MFDPNDSFNHENKENESAPVNDSSRTEQDSTSENTQANASGTQWDGEMYHGIPRTEDQQTSGTEETPKAGDSEPESSSQFPHSFTSDQDSDSANSGGAYSQYNTYGSDAKPDEPHWDMPYRPYGSAGSGPENPTPAPKKEKKHIFRKVLVGALACLIVSAGSVAGFAALINNGTIKIQSSSSSSTPAFTIVQDSTSSSSSASSSSSKTSTTNTATSSSELTKQEVAQKVLPRSSALKITATRARSAASTATAAITITTTTVRTVPPTTARFRPQAKAAASSPQQTDISSRTRTSSLTPLP